VAGAGEAIPHVQAGRLRVISVLGRERSKLFPEVPSSGESGFDTGAPAWSGFYAPRGLPAEARNKLEQALDAAFHSEIFQRVCVERGMEPRLLLGEAFREFASAQSAFFASTIPSLLRHE